MAGTCPAIMCMQPEAGISDIDVAVLRLPDAVAALQRAVARLLRA
jgi:hypothetical protein